MIIRQITTAVIATVLGGCLYVAHAQNSSKERVEAFAKLPDWSGLWEGDILVGQADGQQLSPEGRSKAKALMDAMRPTFSAAWQPKYDQAKKAMEATVAADPNRPPATNTPCEPPPFPATYLPGIYEWRVTPEEVTLINTLGSVRHIYTDGRSHPSKHDLWPTRMGDSVGHWEDDTLVVDTVATKPEISVFEKGFAVTVQMSDQLHFVERIRMVNHNEMQIQFTTEDPVALAKPIEATITYVRVTDINRMIDDEFADCGPGTDRNPVVNGRFSTVVH
jgi:hypothetical protein